LIVGSGRRSLGKVRDKKQQLCQAAVDVVRRDVDDVFRVVARVVHAVAAGLGVIAESAQIPRAI